MKLLKAIIRKVYYELKNDPFQGFCCAVSLIGVGLVSQKIYLTGWILNAIGDVLWIWWSVKKDAYWLILLQIAFLLIAINGIRNA